MSLAWDRCKAGFDLLSYKPLQCPINECTKTQCFECWTKEARDNKAEFQSLEESKTGSSDAKGYCSFHKLVLEENDFVIMYDKLDTKWVDTKAAVEDIKVVFKIQTLSHGSKQLFGANSKSSEVELKVGFANSLEKTKDTLLSHIKDKLDAEGKPILFCSLF